MKFVLTEHAKKRCTKRKIKHEWIENALNNPFRLDNDMEDTHLVHALWPVPEKGFRVLRVIYKENVEPIAIITAYFDNQVIFP